jgi:hypothetical protein
MNRASAVKIAATSQLNASCSAVSEEEVVGMARRFQLVYRVVGTTVYVWPAIVEGP